MTFHSLKCYLSARGRRTPATLGLHMALLLIVTGALVTHFTGKQGTVTLMRGAASPTVTYLNAETGKQGTFPFGITLDDCTIEYYPGTSSPMDYVSTVTVTDGNRTIRDTIAMNRIFIHRHWRFYQTGISGTSSTLTVAHDPWGIGITYAGYLLLFISMVAFFLQRHSLWRTLLHTATARTAAMVALMLIPGIGYASPKTLQRPLAADFGRLWVSRGDRTEQMQSFATDFTRKLCGKPAYAGMTAEQVLTGWLFYYDDWKHEPMIKVKNDRSRKILGIEGDYAALTDFFDARGYKLEEAVRNDLTDKELRRLDECVALISSVATGAAMRIYPCTLTDGRLEWLSWVDRHPESLSAEQWEFIVTTHSRLFTDVAHGRNIAADSVIHRIMDLQQSVLPPRMSAVASAERTLNRLYPITAPAGVVTIVCAVITLMLSSGSFRHRRRRITFLIPDIMLALTGCFCLSILILRAVIGNHWPLSDGYETLLFTGFLSAIIALFMRHGGRIVTGGGLLISGCALICAHITNTNPTVTPLMPVLASPWLAIHVMLVMGAYTLTAFMTVAGITGASTRSDEKAARMSRLNYLILLPAVFLLMAGIFTGAIWANTSWGRYWGWDPKETCALVTLLYYAVPLHRTLIRTLRSPRAFNAYIAAGILVVLFTYFGVNYLLPGLHSYAVR